MYRVLLLVSANNGLTQRAGVRLRRAGYSVRIAVVSTSREMLEAVSPQDFDVIICPFLTHKIPHEIYTRYPTVIIHPGPVGDRGPSSLDWAISMNEPVWGVTALSAVEEMDAGPIWATRSFEMPHPPLRKSALYNGAVADAAIECILIAAARACESGFTSTPAEQMPHPVASARERPAMKQADRALTWDSDTAQILRAVAAADGSPGLLMPCADEDVFIYDAHSGPTPETDAKPGTLLARHHTAVQIATGDASVWIGHARRRIKGTKTFKLPATMVLPDASNLPVTTVSNYQEITYRRSQTVGYLSINLYNGAMSTMQCHRVFKALKHALQEDTRVLVLTGGFDYFSNGIHLNVIEAAPNAAQEAWANITAINAISRLIAECTSQVIVAAFTGNAGAGGVMMPLGANVLAAREGVVLNPHYATMGLFGSELHTYTLPRRVGHTIADRLTTECLPIGVNTAQEIGLVDALGPRDPARFTEWLSGLASEYAEESMWKKTLDAKATALAEDTAERPIDAYIARELGEMALDMFDDRNGFAEKRHNFVYKL